MARLLALALGASLAACAATPSNEEPSATSVGAQESDGLARFYGRWTARTGDAALADTLHGFSSCQGGDIVIERPALWTSWLSVRCAEGSAWVGYFQPGNYSDAASVRHEGDVLWLDQWQEDGRVKDSGVYTRACLAGADCPRPVPLPRGDVTAGEAAFRPCRACHALDDDGVGPKLRGVLGRRAGSVPGFDYSDAFAGSDVRFDEEALDAFLAAPQKVVPGNQMVFPGIADPQRRRDLVAYLTSQR